MICVKSLLHTTLGWRGQSNLRWFTILIHPIYFPCMSSCFWSPDLMNFLHFFMRADIPNFFMSRLVFVIDQPSVHQIRLWPYQGCSSWILSSFCFSLWSRISVREFLRSDDRARENIREKILYPTLCMAFLWFSSYTSLTKSVFFIFFFHSLNNNAKRSDNARVLTSK